MTKKTTRKIAGKTTEKMSAQKLIDILFPGHSRPSCSDENPCNGSFSSEECSRCTAIKIMGGQLPSKFSTFIVIREHD